MANVNKTIHITIDGKEVENNLKSIRAAITKTTNELNKMTVGSDEYIAHSKKLAELKKIYVDYRKELKLTEKELKAGDDQLNNTIINIGALSSAYMAASVALKKFVSSTQQYVDAYATIDDAMTNVSKYTGLTREEVKQLNEEFKKIDTRTPTEKLNALAADAGRLGITSKEAVKDFVEAADIINTALGEDLGEDAVKNIGKMAQMFGESETMGLRGAMIATASAVNSLGQSSSASEPYIVEFTSRLAGVANTAGITQANIMGIASTMDQNMGQVEKSATAVQKVMMDMMSKTGKYAELVGMTSEEFKKLVDSDMNAAFLSVLDALNRISSQGGSALAETLSKLKLNGAGVQETLMSLANNTDKLREAQTLAAQAYRDGNSVIKEAEAVNGNAAAQLEIAKKRMQDARAELGEKLIPIVTKLYEVLGTTSGLLTKYPAITKALISALAAYAAIMVTVTAKAKLMMAVEKAHSALVAAKTAIISTHKTVVLAASVAYNTMTGSTTRAAAAQKLLKVAFASTPWGAIITAVVAVGAALVSFIKNTNDATSAMKEFNSSVAKEQAEVDYLFTKLKNAKKGTDDYKEALQQLIDKYPEVMAKHIDEKGRLDDINQAYQDIIQSIRSKIAMDMKEKQITAANEKALEEQMKQLDRARKNIRKQLGNEDLADMVVDDLKRMLDSGSDQEIRKLIKDSGIDPNRSVSMIDGQLGTIIGKYRRAGYELKNQIEDISKAYDPFIQKTKTELEEMYDRLKQLQSAYYAAEDKEPYKNQIKELREKIRLKEEESKISQRESENTSTTTNGNSSSSSEDPIADFEKKLADFRKRQQNASLEGWAKTKQGIIDSYQEMIDEANKLGKEDVAKQLTGERDSAIKVAGEKYMNKMTNMLVEFVKQAETLKADGGEESELSRIIVGTNEEWEKKIVMLKENITTVKNILSDLPEGDENRTVMESALKQMQSQLLNSASEQAKAVSNAIKEYTKSTDDFIKKEQRMAAEATMTEKEREIAAINERYDVEIKRLNEIVAARELSNAEDPELPSLREKLELLEKMRDKAVSGVGGERLRGGSVWERLFNIDWKNFKDNWQDNLQTMTGALQEFANAAFDIFNSINQIQTNQENAAFDEWCDIQDEKADRLNQQLEDGVISQEYYNAQMEAMEKERAEKEKKLQHEQFERERIASLAQAVINGALSITMILGQMGPVLGAVPMALSAAMTAAQMAVIASQANPYARGGYINGEQLALMGEEGQEWVASNKLVKDKKTAPVIAALEAYQRGDQNAIDELTAVSEPAWGKVSQGSKKLSRTFASQSQAVTNVYNTNSNNTVADTSELLNELKQMNRFLSDPKNRQAYISRKTQLEFEKNENELKEMARL